MRGDVRVVIEIDGAAQEVLQALLSVLGSGGSTGQGLPGTTDILGGQDAGTAPARPGTGETPASEPSGVSAALNAGPAPSGAALTSRLAPAATGSADTAASAADMHAGAAPRLPMQ